MPKQTNAKKEEKTPKQTNTKKIQIPKNTLKQLNEQMLIKSKQQNKETNAKTKNQ